MTHPLFRSDVFVETAFERRFQAMLRSALHKRSWHVIVADPGSGKTMGIREMVQTTGSPVILAVTAPKNIEDEQALGDQLFAALGLKLTGHWRTRKPKLMGHLHQFGTKLLIVDDAHDLSLEHLMFIKEITDQGRLHYDHPLGLCLVAAGRGNTIPLKEIFDQPETMWLQFRRRLDKLEPYCRIAGHTSEEVRDILAALETVYRELFPQINLRQWSGAIYTWLTQSVLDPTNSGRVTMDYLMKLVTTALEWSYEASETNVRPETLEKAAELLVLRRDTLWIIDGAGPVSDATQSDSTGQDQASGTEGEGVSESANPPENTVQAHTSQTDNEDQTSSTQSKPAAASHDAVMDQKQPVKLPKCTFSGVVPIELKRFLDSGIGLVECPDCVCTRTLKPHGGVLQFKHHDKRKTSTPNTEPRWAKVETDWDVVGAERK
jgi:AAA domain